MDTLKKIFPLSFKTKSDVPTLIVHIIIHFVIGIIAGALIFILSKIPVLGIIVTILSSLIELYLTAGIVLTFLDYFNVIK